ncbi:MAG: hypothetical protein ACREYC_01085 [Gammaproteobacteria bacterium]
MTAAAAHLRDLLRPSAPAAGVLADARGRIKGKLRVGDIHFGR